jgi:hypothetical protein
MRTTNGDIHIRVRVDNPTDAGVRVRVASVRALTPPRGAVRVSGVHVNHMPLGQWEAERSGPAASWVEVAPRQSAMLTVFLDYDEPRWDGHTRHSYRVTVAREGGRTLTTVADCDDARRIPR